VSPDAVGSTRHSGKSDPHFACYATTGTSKVSLNPDPAERHGSNLLAGHRGFAIQVAQLPPAPLKLDSSFGLLQISCLSASAKSDLIEKRWNHGKPSRALRRSRWR
jgi:hypothetical protein